MIEGDFDYIIVGAGSAGSALAARLSERPDLRVLVLEAGGEDKRFWVRLPLGVGKILNDARYVWQYHTDPEPALGGRSLYWAHGRMLGGSSSVNGMLYVRGEAARFDAWRDADCPGWGYRDLLPIFKRIEDCPFGDPAYRGRDGPIPVKKMPAEDPISQGFIEACQESGLPMNPDYNAETLEGVANQQFNIKSGWRNSAATGYLHPARGRPNLTVVTNAQVERIVADGNRASGVALTLDGETRTVEARREVILSAGALHSPHLLELSGIGNGDLLASRGVAVVKHLPGVGENLSDHLQARISFEATEPVTINDMLRSRWILAKELAKFAIFRRGLFTTPSFRAHAFAASDLATGFPDTRIQCGLMSGPGRYAHEGMDDHPGFHIGSYFIYPHSRGHVHLKSPDPREAPAMLANYLDDERDQAASLWGMRMNRRIAASPALRSIIVREVRPGPDTDDDDTMLDFVRETGQTAWHFVGTCKMGTDALAVVDPQLRVHGIAGLRIADASVMPFQVSSNTNVPSIAIGEKAADIILEDA